jgi:NIPSNAP
MIIEQRFYQLRPECMKPWLALWERAALPLQLEYIGSFGGRFLGMYLSEVGQVNEITHLWQHLDIERRMAMRAVLERDPRWALYRDEVDALAPMLSMRNTILRPTPFSPTALEPVTTAEPLHEKQ